MMAAKPDEFLLRWRWGIITLIALSTVVIEIVEHSSLSFQKLDFDLVREVLLFGIAFPLVGGLMLNWLVQLRGKVTDPTATFNHIPAEKRLPIPRVLVVGNESLLGAGIECLLATETALDVGGVTPGNESVLFEAIKHLQPDVIIVDEALLLTIPIRLLTDLLDYPDIRVVIISADTNRVQVYDRQQLLVTQFTDLVKLIRYTQTP